MRSNFLKNQFVRLLSFTIGLGLLAACAAPAAPEPLHTADSPTATSQPTLVPTRVPPTASASTPDDALDVVGKYPVGQFGLELEIAADGNAVLHTPATQILPATSWSGSWANADAGAVVTLTAKSDGTLLSNAPVIKLDVLSDTLQVTAFGVNGQFYDRAEWGFALTTGVRNGQVAVLNELLANVPYLNYTAPLTDTEHYTELVRRAVARFQAVEGLQSSGAVTPDTWLHLLSRSYAQVPSSPVEFTIAFDVVNIRSGPGTNFAVSDRRYRGEVMDVVGKMSGATPQSTWLQVCCVATDLGWVQSDLGTLSGSLDQVPEIPPDQLPQVPTPRPAGQQTSRARAGMPLLADLPSFTADGRPVAYITFDDGPNGAVTQQILDALTPYDARATFCVIGSAVGPGTAIVRDTTAALHYICNHTWSHVSLNGISRERFVQEADSTKAAIKQAAGDLFALDNDVRILRPPYGATDANTRQFAADLGYDVLMWDVDPQDWARPGAQAIVDNVVNYTFPGAVILLHDGGGERSQTVAALPQILAALSQRGYVFFNIYGN